MCCGVLKAWCSAVVLLVVCVGVDIDVAIFTGLLFDIVIYLCAMNAGSDQLFLFTHSNNAHKNKGRKKTRICSVSELFVVCASITATMVSGVFCGFRSN